jgi:hypothetical protein
MAGKSFKEIIVYLKAASYTGRHDLYNYQEALTTTIERNENLIYEDIKLFVSLPLDFYTSVIRVITRFNHIELLHESLDIYKIMLKNIIKEMTSYKEVISEINRTLENIFLEGEPQVSYLPVVHEIVIESLDLTTDYFLNSYKRE